MSAADKESRRCFCSGKPIGVRTLPDPSVGWNAAAEKTWAAAAERTADNEARRRKAVDEQQQLGKPLLLHLLTFACLSKYKPIVDGVNNRHLILGMTDEGMIRSLEKIGFLEKKYEKFKWGTGYNAGYAANDGWKYVATYDRGRYKDIKWVDTHPMIGPVKEHYMHGLTNVTG